MQKYLLLIFIITFSNYTLANSLPQLPISETNTIKEPPSATVNKSNWQKVKNFFGMGNENNIEETGNEKSVDQANLRTDIALSEDINRSDILPINNNQPMKDNDFQHEDKKLDISDDFFKEVEKHLQEEDKIITDTTKSENAANQHELNPVKGQELPAVSLPIEPPINQADNKGNQETKKNSEIIKLPQGVLVLDKEEVTRSLPSKEEKQEDIKALSKEPIIKPTESKPMDSKSYAVSKFKEEIERRNAKRSDDLPKISEEDLAHNGDRLLSNVSVTDSKQLKFIADEAKVLIISNDDIVLGELTEEATLELMDFSSYVQLFWRDFDKLKRFEGRQVIDDFIDNYDDNFNKVIWPLSSDDPYEKLNDAFAAISKQDINKFITILNNYPILGIKDKEKNSVLHQAAYLGNYSAVKLLIMKGIRLNDLNRQDETPLSIAEKYDNPYVAYLLKKAGAVALSN